jgi:hypothetical protein
MLVVLLGYQYFFKPKPDARRPPHQTQSQRPQQPAAKRPASRSRTSRRAAAVAAGPSGHTPAVAAALETETTLSRTSSTRSSSPIAARRSSTGF